MTSTLAAGLVDDPEEGLSASEAMDGQMTSSTILEGCDGVWEAIKSRAVMATFADGRRRHDSFGRPNLTRHREAS